jgi:hypothetical protein
VTIYESEDHVIQVYANQSERLKGETGYKVTKFHRTISKQLTDQIMDRMTSIMLNTHYPRNRCKERWTDGFNAEVTINSRTHGGMEGGVYSPPKGSQAYATVDLGLSLNDFARADLDESKLAEFVQIGMEKIATVSQISSPTDPVDELSERIESRLLSADNASDLSFLYTYYGPVVWSKPQERIQVSRTKDFRTEYIQLAQHFQFIVEPMYEKGITDPTEAIKKSSAHFVIATIKSCPDLPTFVDQLSALAVTQMETDSKSDSSRVLTDGGFSYHYNFNTKALSSFEYIDYWGRNNLKGKLDEFKNYLVKCGVDEARFNYPTTK